MIFFVIVINSSKIIDNTVDEQLTENASLRMILQWYEKHVYRHLYLPLFQTEVDQIIKCVCIEIYSDARSILSL